jgi:hypothetical protein
MGEEDMKKQYDVIVAGGGPSGTAAAVYAAKNGAKTLLVEREGAVGGMSTAGDINCWCGTASSGFFDTLFPLTSKKIDTRVVFDPELLKSVYLDMLLDAGVELLLHAVVTGAEKSGAGIKGLTAAGTGGTVTLEAGIFIDSTGDGDLAFLADLPFDVGREQDGLIQPGSLMFMLGNIDEDRAVYPGFGTHPEYQSLMKQAVEEGKIPGPAGHIICIKGYQKGTAGINMTNVTGVNGTDLESLTRAEILARRQIPGIVEFLCKNLPGYENCYVISTGTRIGIRESRRFRGDFCLTQEHIQANTVFDDWVVSGADYGFGNHNLTGSGRDKSSDTPYNHKGYTIPYGCFLPTGIENLYLNGRNISGTHMAHSSYRVMPICMAMGQSVGTAAALAIKAGGNIRNMDIPKLQGVLISQGVSAP